MCVMSIWIFYRIMKRVHLWLIPIIPAWLIILQATKQWFDDDNDDGNNIHQL